MTVTIIEEKNTNNWDLEIADYNSSPFISTKWLNPFKSTHAAPVFFKFKQNDTVIAVIAGLKIESPNKVLKVLYKEMIFFSGPAILKNNEDLTKICVDKLIDYATKKGFVKINLKSWLYPVNYKVTNPKFHKILREEFVIDLKQDLDLIYKNIKKGRMRYIKKAKKNGLIVSEGKTIEHVEKLLEQLEQTKASRIAKGHKEYSYKYLPYFSGELIFKMISNGVARLFYAKKNEDIISTLLFICNKKNAFALLSGVNDEGYKHAAPGLLWYETIRIFKEDKAETFSMGGGLIDDPALASVNFIKLSFGAKKEICSGGHTDFLQGNLHKLFINSYYKISDNRLIATLRKKVKGEY